MSKSHFAAALGMAALLLSGPMPGLDRAAMDRLLALARSQPDSAAFREVLVKSLGEPEIQKGEAFQSNGRDFVFAVANAKAPALIVDDKPAGSMRRIAGSDLWFFTGQLAAGISHRFHYLINGAKFGGSYDVPAYTPASYGQPGVPQGKLSEKHVNVSKVYAGPVPWRPGLRRVGESTGNSGWFCRKKLI